MSRLSIFLFCAGSLCASVGLASILFPLAAMSPNEVSAASSPRDMQDFADIDMGEDYGEMSVAELMGYYLENPPAPPAAGMPAPAPKRHFGGC